MDPKDQKDIEEMIKKAILEQQQNPARLFLLHPRFELHILILILLNLIVGIMTFSFGVIIKVPLINITLLSYIIFIISVSLIEIIIKVLLVKIFKGILIFSVGLINYIMQALIFYGTDLLIDNLAFVSIRTIFIYTLIFLILRYFMMILIRKYTFQKRK